MDGYVVIKTKLDTKTFDAQISEVEDKIEDLDWQLSNQKKLGLDSKQTQEIGVELEKLRNKLIGLNHQKEKAEKPNISNILKSLKNMDGSMGNIIKKVLKCSLAVFGLRSAYSAVRSAMSTLSQYDKQMATNIEYIHYALAYVLKPVVEGLINLVYKLLVYVNYLAKAWFGVNLFSKSSAAAFKKAQASTSKMSKDTKEVAKNLADGIDEITNLDDNTKVGNSLDDNIASPSFDLNTKDIKIPKWLEWLSKNGKKVKDIIIGIGSAIAAIKIAKLLTGLGEFSGILGELATIGIIAIGVSLLYTALTGRDILDDINEIKKGLNDLNEINDEQVEKAKTSKKNTQELIEKYHELDNTIGASKEQTDIYFNTLLNGINTNNDLIDSLETQKNWLGEITGANDELTQSQTIYNEVIDNQLEELKNLYEQGKLNKTEKEKYIDTLKKQVDKLNDNNQKLSKNSDEYKNNTSKIKELQKQLEKITGKKYEIKTSVGKPETTGFKGAINEMIRGIEEIFDTAKWAFTGKANTVKLPRLASGGIVNNPGKGVFRGSYIAGEAGPEAILPLSNSGFIQDFAKQVSDNISSGLTTDLLLELNRNISELADRPMVLNVNGKAIAQATYKDFQTEGNRLNNSTSIKVK